jgi:hypothetical protein
VYMKTYVSPRELSNKLIFPAVGPYAVINIGIDRRTYNVNTPDGEVTISVDRVRKCPFPAYLPEGMMFASNVNEENAAQSRDEDDLSDLEEYVIDHLVSQRREEKGAMNIRVRWFGHDSSSDTWEPLLHIPPEIIRRYVERKKLWLRRTLTGHDQLKNARYGTNFLVLLGVLGI